MFGVVQGGQDETPSIFYRSWRRRRRRHDRQAGDRAIRPALKWRLAASWPKSLDTIYGACDTFSKYVSEATDGKFQIQNFAAGEIVPGLQVLDAASRMAPSNWATAPSTTTSAGIPPWRCSASSARFNCRQQNAWFYEGEGQNLIDDFGKKFNVRCLPMGNTGTQMGGWFNKELKEPADLMSAFSVVIRSKADMAFCTAHVRF